MWVIPPLGWRCDSGAGLEVIKRPGHLVLFSPLAPAQRNRSGSYSAATNTLHQTVKKPKKYLQEFKKLLMDCKTLVKEKSCRKDAL